MIANRPWRGAFTLALASGRAIISIPEKGQDEWIIVGILKIEAKYLG